jgi:hypothetical protein
MTTPGEPWYRPPVIWLGVGIFLLSIAGCIGVIASALRYPDESVPHMRGEVLKVPPARAPESRRDAD